MRKRRVREAAIATIIGFLLAMGLCNGVVIGLFIVSFGLQIGDNPSRIYFSLDTEHSSLGFFLFMGVGAVFEFISTLNRPKYCSDRITLFSHGWENNVMATKTDAALKWSAEWRRCHWQSSVLSYF
jgi:hypothetical protein